MIHTKVASEEVWYIIVADSSCVLLLNHMNTLWGNGIASAWSISGSREGVGLDLDLSIPKIWTIAELKSLSVWDIDEKDLLGT